MLISGTEIDTQDIDSIIKELIKLPSGFSEQSNYNDKCCFKTNSNAKILFTKGESFHNKWKETKSSSDLEDAIACFKNSAVASESYEGVVLQACILFYCGEALKNANPFHLVPVILRAMADRLLNFCPPYSNPSHSTST